MFLMVISSTKICGDTTTGYADSTAPTHWYSIRSGALRQVISTNSVVRLCSATVMAASTLRSSELEALDLSGRRLRQVGDKQNFTRILVRRQPALHE